MSLSGTFLLASASFALLVGRTTLAQDFGCSGPCWEQCLGNGGEYQNIYDSYLRPLIGKARDLRFDNPDSKGTAFILDSTATPSTKFEYQQTLASIVALTMPVEFNDRAPTRSCNPFFVSQYFENAAWSFPHWQCLDHCDAAFFLQGLPHFPERFMLPPNGPDPDALGAGCYFGNWAATHPNSFAIPCATERYSRRELAIAFVNSKDQGQYATTGECQTYFPDTDKKLLVQVNPGPTLPPLFPNHINMQDEELLPAAQQLLKCMVERCCRRRLSDAKAVDLGKVSITYRDPKADPGAKRRVSVEEGTVEEIAKKYFGGRLPETTLPK